MKQRQSALEEIEADYSELLSGGEVGGKPRLAAWGLVKAGKSSLLNMLSGHFRDEYFKTGVVRTTIENSELETDGYILVDTPGLGIDAGDNKEAFKGLDGADVIIFVHAPQGELDQEEIDLLRQIKTSYGSETEKRLILVLSKLDMDQNGSVELIHQSVMSQLDRYIGVRPACFMVSNTRYQKGASENKSTLMQKSGIPALVQHLDALASEVRETLHSVRSSRKAAKKSALLTKIEHAMRCEAALISEIQGGYAERARSFNKIMDGLRGYIGARAGECRAARKELENI